MKVILDVNILLSAFIKDSTTREIIVKSGFSFYFPEPSLEKIKKYQTYILKKSGLQEQEFSYLFSLLFKYITLLPKEDLLKNWDIAKEIMEKIDQEDVIFIAAALATPNAFIWSDDKDFDRQQRIAVFKTKEIVLLFYDNF